MRCASACARCTPSSLGILGLLAAACAESPAPDRPPAPPWGGAPRQPLDLRASVSDRDVALLERTDLTLDLLVAEGVRWSFEPHVPAGFAGEASLTLSRAVPGGTWWRWSLALYPERPGELEIPPFRAVAADGTAVAESAPLTVAVRSALDSARQEPGTAGIEPPPRLPAPAPIWPWVATLAALGVLLWLRRRRRRAEPLADPAVSALDELTRLRSQPGRSEVDVEQLHADVERIVRGYLATHLGPPSKERTTAELLAALEARAVLTTGQQATLGALLHQCDLVKFARALPAEDAQRAALTGAEELLRSRNGNGSPARG